jgi:hypothetical protein
MEVVSNDFPESVYSAALLGSTQFSKLLGEVTSKSSIGVARETSVFHGLDVTTSATEGQVQVTTQRIELLGNDQKSISGAAQVAEVKSETKTDFARIEDNRSKIMKVSLPDSNECINVILSQNFDRVSTPCVLTIVKYVQNILSDPFEPKFRALNTANKTFQEKVVKALGSLEFLQSIGFVEVPGSSSLRIDSSVDFLERTLQVLQGAMDQLNIPASDRPKIRIAAVAPYQLPEQPEWDPYKSSIVRTAPQVTSHIY